MSNDTKLRNRVAGAVVLVSLAVIFLPLILDGQKKSQILESYIPDKPKTGEIILVNVEEALKNQNQGESVGEAQSKEALSEKQEPPKTTIPVEEINTKATENVRPKPTEVIKAPEPQVERHNRPDYKMTGFLIQVGSFGQYDNARKLVSTLQDKAYKSYLKKSSTASGMLYRVYVGPYLSRDKAEKEISTVGSLAGTQPIVVSYDPVKHAQG